jgi:hypothetical protein
MRRHKAKRKPKPTRRARTDDDVVITNLGEPAPELGPTPPLVLVPTQERDDETASTPTTQN